MRRRISTGRGVIPPHRLLERSGHRCAQRTHLRVFAVGFVVTWALLAAACGDSPTGPTDSSASALTGVVRDTFGEPISGARVEIVDGPLAGHFTLTTAAGLFSIQMDRTALQGLRIRITRDGFSPVTRAVFDVSTLEIVMTSLEPFALHGDYSIVFSAAADCAAIPASFRMRTYAGRLRAFGHSNGLFTIELAGADLYPGYGTFFGNSLGAAARFWVSSWEAFDRWLEEQPIFERLNSSAYISFVGSASSSDADPSRSISVAFDGSITYCPSFRPDSNPLWPPVCTTPVMSCQSNMHRLTLVRR